MAPHLFLHRQLDPLHRLHSKHIFGTIRRDCHDAFTLWHAVEDLFQDNEMQRVIYLETAAIPTARRHDDERLLHKVEAHRGSAARHRPPHL